MAAAMTKTSTSSSSSSPTNPHKNHGVLSSPWAQLVKAVGDSPENSESSPSENLPAAQGNVGKQTVWKKPTNVAAGGVMGAASWPALSESTRLKSSSDSSKSPPDISFPLSQGHVTSHSQQPRSNANTNQSSTINSGAPTRQRSIKRGGNRQGGFSRVPPPPPPLPAFPIPEFRQSSFTKRVVSKPDSLRESRPTGGFSSHSNASNEHSNHRSSNGRGNFSQHNRGDGRNNHHERQRDHDHGRGVHGLAHRPHGRGFMGPSVQGGPPYAPPPPVRPYGNTLLYPDHALVCYIPSLPMDSFTGVPYFTGPLPPPYLAMTDPLRASIIKQIEYYFSDANLVKDEFLKSKMDEQGWVPITLIASFPRVGNLTDNIPFILDCLRGSTIVEVQGDKVRRYGEWLKWIKPQQSSSDSSVQSPVGYGNLTASIQRMSLEENQCNTSSALMEKELTKNFQEASVQRVC